MNKHVMTAISGLAVVVIMITPASFAHAAFVPPVANFSASAKSATAVTLSWDTPQYADAASFDVRYSASAITESNFSGANQVSVGVPLPISALTQSMDVTGLTASTTYYFALRIIDKTGTASSAVFSSATTQAAAGGGEIGGGAGGGTGGGTVIIPPVANLSTTSTLTDILVSWDTPQYGNATSFEMRYSTSTLTDANFSSGTFVSAMPLPIASTRQQKLVSGLSSSTTYYFGIKLLSGSHASLTMYIPGTTLTPASTGGGNTGGGGSGGNTGGGGSVDGRVGIFIHTGGGVGPVVPQVLAKPGFVINGGAAKTDSPLVTLTISAKDYAEMMIANSSDFAGSVWEPTASSTRWGLTNSNGVKTVYMKYRTPSTSTEAFASSSILLEVPVQIVQNVIHEIRYVSGADARIEITPNQLTVGYDKRVVVVLTAIPSGQTYRAHVDLSYPSDWLKLEKVEYGQDWVPEYGAGLDNEDPVKGLISKTAHFSSGYSTPKHFATLTFVATNLGAGTINILEKNSLASTHAIEGGPQNESTFMGKLGDKKLQFANILFASGLDSYEGLLTLGTILVLLYLIILMIRDKYRHGRVWFHHGFVRKQK